MPSAGLNCFSSALCLPLEELKWIVELEALERRQEGYDVDPEEYARRTQEAATREELLKLYTELLNAPRVRGYPYEEPADLEGILRARPGGLRRLPVRDAELRDKVYGGWFGRVAGCMLGKPVEGWSREKIRERLKAAGEYPLRGPYFPPAVLTESELALVGRLVRGHVCGALRDDDLDYTVLNLLVYEEKGADFETRDVGSKWLELLPYALTYTAERAAYRNLVLGLEPPLTALCLNPFREWIGAQIRADVWGYVSPGDPERASTLAYRDAVLSHTKNGVYGEMLFAAMVAAAFSLDDPVGLVREALKAIPRKSRLAEAVSFTLRLYESGTDWEEAVERILERYSGYHPVHTINNAALVVAAILWGEGDWARTVCLAAMSGLDADCNCATAGSVVGVMRGIKGIPREWLDPLNDTLETGLATVGRVKISELAERTLRVIKARVWRP